ncbi:MAG: hypothetical protein PVI09_15350 [Anaerolineae bacterium]|jgi:hypothetical protein
MENTYTYTARSLEHPEQVVTFTLQDHSMSVDLGAPLEQLESALQQLETEEAAGAEGSPQRWLRPMAVSLLERGIGPFRVTDVRAAAEEDWLRVKAWYRAGGLAVAPVTLIDGRVDNRQAAQAFVQELDRRKSEAGSLGWLNVLDYWFTWVLAGILLVGLFQVWRRKTDS